MTRHLPAHLARLGAFGAMVLVCASLVLAEGEADRHTDPEAPIRFRRIFAPADRVDAWPKGKQRYEPMDTHRFEQLVEEAAHGPAEDGHAARIEVAEYEAGLDGDELLVGRAEFRVRHEAKGSVFMPFGPCRLAIASPNWIQGDAVQPALLGTDPRNRLTLVVPASGRLTCEWSLRGHRDSTGSVRFHLQLPRAMSHRMVLSLPKDRKPTVTGGLIVPMSGAPKSQSKWEIVASGDGDLHLRVTDREVVSEDQPVNLLRQRVEYNLSARGLAVRADLQLDIYRQPLAELAVRLGSGLQLVSAQLGAEKVPWSSTFDRATGGNRVVFHFTEPIRGTERTLRLHAVAPVTTDARWTLPRVQAENLAWHGGRATLRIAAPLTLADLVLRRCRQSGVGASPEAADRRTVHLQYFSSDAEVELVLARSRSELEVDSMTSIELSERQLVARLTADLSVVGQPRFKIDADVEAGWQIESLACDPPDAMEGWALEGSARRQRIAVRFRKSIREGRPVRLTIAATSRQSLMGNPMDQDALRVVRFVGVANARESIHIHAKKPFQVRHTAFHARHQIDLAVLAKDDRIRASDRGTGLAWRVSDSESAPTIELHKEQPRFAVENHLAVRVRHDAMTEHYRIVCTPQSSAIDRLVVHFVEPLGGALEWSLDGSEDSRVTVKRWPVQQQEASGLGLDGEVCELSWPSARTEPFEVTAQRSIGGTASRPVNLFSVPHAGREVGFVTTYSADGASLEVENQGLKAIPGPVTPSRQFGLCHGAYRYDPRQWLRDTARASLRVGPARVDPPMVVWQASMETRFGKAGEAIHRVVLEVENEGASQLVFTIPEEVPVATAAVLGKSVPILPVASDGRSSVPLPEGRRFVTVVLQYSTSASGMWGGFGRIACPLPQFEVPVIAWSRTLNAPPGYVVLDSVDGGGNRSTHGIDWRRRLLGPFARAEEQPVFDPTNRASWRRLFDAISINGFASLWRRAAPASGLQDDGSLTRVFLVHRSLLQALAGTTFLVFLAGFYAWLPSHRSWCLGVGAGLAIVALLVPAILSPIASSALLGFVAAMLVRSLVFWLPPVRFKKWSEWGGRGGRNVRPGSTVRARIAPGADRLIILLALSIAMGPSADLRAAPRSEKATRRAPLYRVFVPIDENKSPVGNTVYVPRTMFDQLHKRALRGRGRVDWLISQATYRGQLDWNATRGQLEFGDLTAIFELEVTSRRAQVRLPIRASGSEFQIKRVILDGQPIRLVSEGRSEEKIVPIDEPGVYRLEVVLRPKSKDDASLRRIDLAIPPLSTARLELRLPADAPKIEIESAFGRVRHDTVAGRITADLGGSDRLTMTWEPVRERGETVAMKVDRLLWLKVKPGAVVVNAQLKVNLRQSTIRQLRLAADSRLRWLPSGDRRAGALGDYQVRVLPGDPQTIVLDFPRMLSGQQEINLTFLLTGASGVGSVRLPYLKVLDASDIVDWVAVSIDPSLRIDTSQLARRGALAPVTPAEFSRRWPLVSVPSGLRYRQSDLDVDWTFAAYPLEPVTSGDEQLTLSFGMHEVDLHYQADLETTVGDRCQYRLRVPSDFVVRQVSLRAEGGERVERWARTEGGILTLFLDGLVTGRQRIHVVGSQPVRKKLFRLSKLRLLDHDLRSTRLKVYRREDVLVETSSQPDPGSLGDDRGLEDLGRWVGTYRLDGQEDLKERVTFSVTPNDVKADAVLVTSLSRRKGSWMALIDYRLKVTQGVVDDLQFRLPADWSGPFEIEPDLPYTLIPATSGGGSTLVIRPPEAISDHVRVRIVGPLSLASDARVSVPDVVDERASVVERFVVLPRHVELQNAQWETLGLREATLPEDPESPPLAFESVQTFQVVSPRSQAVLKSVERSRATPQIRLADVHVRWSWDGRYVGLALFDIDPAGVAEIQVDLSSPTSRFLRARVGGLIVPAHRLSDQRWVLPLASEQLPQEVELLFAGQFGTSGSATPTLESPEMSSAAGQPIAVQRTQWSVTSPAGVDASATGERGLHNADRASFRAIQIERFHQLMDLVSDVTSEEPNEVLAPWYQRWQARLESTLRQTESLQAAMETSGINRTEAVAAERQIVDARRRFSEWTKPLVEQGVLDKAPDRGQDTVSRSGSDELWHAAMAERTTVRMTAPGSVASIDARAQRLAGSGLFGRIAAAIVLATLVFGAIYLMRQAETTWPAYFLPQGVAFAIGLFLWITMTPGLLGLILMGLSVIPRPWLRGNRRS